MKLVSFSKPTARSAPVHCLKKLTWSSISPAAGFADSRRGAAAPDSQRSPNRRLSSLISSAMSACTRHIANPPRVFAIGLNYRDHAIESKMALPKFPVVFFKMSTAIVGPGENIVLPKNSTQPDYEAELAFVIGKGGYRIPASAWQEHVYGYTIVNDVSARDMQLSTSQWSLGKSFPTFCPMGPAIVTADEIADPHELAISLSINGEVLQNSNTRELIFKIPDLSSTSPRSRRCCPAILYPQALLGRGHGPHPAALAQARRSCDRNVEGLGSLTNPVVAE